MNKDDWYRSDEWTSEAQEEFFSRLKRSRTVFHKAQYCYIKACALWRSGDKKRVVAALELTDRILSEWSDDSRIHHTYALRAGCCEELGDLNGAIEDYLRCFALMRRLPKGFDITAPLDFGWLCLRRQLTEHYPLAIELAQESSFIFPMHRFMRAAIISVLTHRSGGDSAVTRDQAMNALKAAGETESGFRRHPQMGLVGDADPEIISELFAIAGQRPEQF
ncbi:MAG: hypothetical protein JNK37_19660 [Verrucomicrobiales bacterium]|nr:hypothetical protein [Verrucomicrobiales bacterium]